MSVSAPDVSVSAPDMPSADVDISLSAPDMPSGDVDASVSAPDMPSVDVKSPKKGLFGKFLKKKSSKASVEVRLSPCCTTCTYMYKFLYCVRISISKLDVFLPVMFFVVMVLWRSIPVALHHLGVSQMPL